jgi:hypothetical protein
MGNSSSNRSKSLYYPGAGYDFSTLRHFITRTRVDCFYYCDYMNYEITKQVILDKLIQELGDNGFRVEHVADMMPEHFGKRNWRDFWHRDAIPFGGSVENSFIAQYLISRKNKTWEFIYFGTEAIETYHVLLQNRLSMDVVVTQDHGLGGLWTTFCRGSFLEKISRKYDSMPQTLLVGEDHEAWYGYRKVSEPFGSFGLHQHPRVLYRLSKKLKHAE